MQLGIKGRLIDITVSRCNLRLQTVLVRMGSSEPEVVFFFHTIGIHCNTFLNNSEPGKRRFFSFSEVEFTKVC